MGWYQYRVEADSHPLFSGDEMVYTWYVYGALDVLQPLKSRDPPSFLTIFNPEVASCIRHKKWFHLYFEQGNPIKLIQSNRTTCLISFFTSHLYPRKLWLRPKELLKILTEFSDTGPIGPTFDDCNLRGYRVQMLQWGHNIVLNWGITKSFQKMKFFAIHAKSLEL